MPKSRVRSKAVYTPPPRTSKSKVSPRWLVPTMVACLLIGLAWIALFYVTQGSLLTAAYAYAPRQQRTLIQVGATVIVLAVLIAAVVTRTNALN